jgi:hypothetical protein
VAKSIGKKNTGLPVCEKKIEMRYQEKTLIKVNKLQLKTLLNALQLLINVLK